MFERVISHYFNTLIVSSEEDSVEDDISIVTLSSNKVCAHYAEVILSKNVSVRHIIFLLFNPKASVYFVFYEKKNCS